MHGGSLQGERFSYRIIQNTPIGMRMTVHDKPATPTVGLVAFELLCSAHLLLLSV